MGFQGNPITILAGEALEPRRFVKFNGTAWVYADAADLPHAVTINYIANGASGPATLLNLDGTYEVEAGGTIAAGDELYTAADGKAAATGTNPVGIARSAATSGGSLEVMPSPTPGAGGVLVATYMSDGTPAATDRAFFVAPFPCRVLAISQVHHTAAGGTSTLDIEKLTGTEAGGAGDLLLATPFDLNATANTTQHGTLTATLADRDLAIGDRLGTEFNHTIQSSAGICVTVILQRL